MALSCIFHILVHTLTNETIERGVTFKDKEILYIVVFFVLVLNTILVINGSLTLIHGFMNKRNAQ